MTNPSGLVVREGFSTITCQRYFNLGEAGHIDQCDASTAEFLAANANCGCTPPPNSGQPCAVCDAGFELAEPETTFNGTSVKPLSCADFEIAADAGLIPPNVCSKAAADAKVACGGCTDVKGPFEPCEPCGAQFIQNPSASFTFETEPTITCGQYEKNARLGYVIDCEIRINVTKASCVCGDAAPTATPTPLPTPVPTTRPPTKQPIKVPTPAPMMGSEPTDSPVASPVEPPVNAPTVQPTGQPVLGTSAKPTNKMKMMMKAPTKQPYQMKVKMMKKASTGKGTKTYVKKNKIYPLIPK